MSKFEEFWTEGRYAVVGHSDRRGFPKLTYGWLKSRGWPVWAVDPGGGEVEGDQTYPDLASLPEPPDAVVLELPPEETADWVERAADAGAARVWIHQRTDTPDALARAESRSIPVLHGQCAVMYLHQGFSIHAIHKWLWRRLSRY